MDYRIKKKLEEIAKVARNISDAAELCDKAEIVHFGVEYAQCGDSEIAYLNMGDTYDMTICENQDTKEIFASSWGDWYEETEIEYCKENDVIRCGYCGEFTDLNDDWQNVICQYCEHCVAG